jgi:hypothetical protein
MQEWIAAVGCKTAYIERPIALVQVPFGFLSMPA